jgi:hypothetical protein
VDSKARSVDPIERLVVSVGYSFTPNGYEAVLRSATGTATALTDLGGQGRARAVGRRHQRLGTELGFSIRALTRIALDRRDFDEGRNVAAPA